MVIWHYSCAEGAQGSEFRVEAGGQTLSARSVSTGSWAGFRSDVIGTLKLSAAGTVTLIVRPGADWKVIGLKSVTLTPG